MLRARPVAPKRKAFWLSDQAYAIVRDEAEVGRIELIARPRGNADAQIDIRGQTFAGRVHITGKAHWTYRESRWALCSEGREMHCATQQSGRAWLTEPEVDIGQLRLCRSMFGGVTVVERASDQTPIGEMRWLRPRLIPKAMPRQIELQSSINLPETFEVFLLWIVVEEDYRNAD